MALPADSRHPTEQLLVGADQSGMRLDRFLTASLPGSSRTRIQDWIARGLVTVDGVPAGKSGTSVAEGARIEVTVPEAAAQRVEDAAGLCLSRIFVDEHLIVVDKPAGMLAHPTSTLRGRTVSELARLEFGELPSLQGRDRPGIVHRLDAGTSGLMVLARSEPAFAGLQRQFRARAVDKRYTAIVHNEPRFDSDWIEAALDRNPKAPQKRMVVADGEGRASSTFYEVRERLRGFALLECRPKTGRTHQIRVHLAHIDLPIVGDRQYKHHGPLRVPLSKSAPELSRQALHASSLAFEHPLTGEPLSFTSPLPEDLARLLAWLRQHHGRA
jgi:23S rRNA pseudouridine1911/1915/1917 synthase